MPDYCDNSLIVSSNDKETLKKFYEENVEPNEEVPEFSCLSFNKSVPKPEFPENDGSWYDWCINNWGTKWEPDDYYYEPSVEMDEETLSFNFHTAWSPPIQWLEAVSKKYPDLHFELRFAGEGGDFSGYALYENGDLQEEREGQCGEYYGERECQICEDGYIQWDVHRYNCCDRCESNSFDTIGKFVRKKKIENLPKKLACMRIGRNAILDNYLMRKVFIPRLNECVI